jgi:hypothetical protein
MLAVEHIQPKALPAHSHLVGRWENFLLACVNCNSTKKDKDVALDQVLLPDRDNTFTAFVYAADGTVQPAPTLSRPQLEMAGRTLALAGLDKKIDEALDENGKRVTIDRISQRMEVWAVAEEARLDVEANPASDALRRCVVRTALGYGFFSIWMTVFVADVDMRNLLVEAFQGTRDSGCFDLTTTCPLSPAPNPDVLPHGGKI